MKLILIEPTCGKKLELINKQMEYDNDDVQQVLHKIVRLLIAYTFELTIYRLFYNLD